MSRGQGVPADLLTRKNPLLQTAGLRQAPVPVLLGVLEREVRSRRYVPTRKPPHVRCKGRLWDVYDIQADDVIFDQRSLMKLAAAFYPKILVPYEDEMMAPADRVHPVWREYVVLAKLGFGWINVESAKPDALILAQNLLRNPQRETHPGGAFSLPRGVKDFKAVAGPLPRQCE